METRLNALPLERTGRKEIARYRTHDGKVDKRSFRKIGAHVPIILADKYWLMMQVMSDLCGESLWLLKHDIDVKQEPRS